jgi:hypothetical protein
MSIRQISIWTTCFIALSVEATSWAQSKAPQQTNKHTALSLHIHTLSYIKNNEYFGPFVEGHTLAGYQVHPYFNYISSPNITTKLGLFLQRDWATTKFFSRIAPTFTLQYQKNLTTFLIGTLDGIHTHRLLRPLCNTESILTQSPETGFRIYHAGKRTFVDLWLHWLTLLDKSHHTPEELMAGFSCEQSLVDTDSFTLQLPLQVVLYHLGGQGIPVKDYSLWTGALGGRINLPISESNFFRSLGLAVYYVTNHYIKQPNRPYPTGHGFYGEVTCQTGWVTLQASYWNARDFSSENLGHPLYQSIQLINKQVTHQEAHRHLAFLHVNYAYNLTKELELVLHIDPYYDINHHLLEHEAGIYISYHPCFELMNMKEPTNNNTKNNNIK